MSEIDPRSAPRRRTAAVEPADPNAQLLLQLVDGRNTIEDISLLLGVDSPRVLALVAQLEAEGHLEFPATGGGGLSSETQALVDRLWADLGRLDAIALLGCSQNPSLEEVRAAYAERARLLDPKRQSGELGAYSEKIPRVYQRVTQGYQVLTTQLAQRAQAQVAGAGRRQHPGSAGGVSNPSAVRIRAAQRASSRPPHSHAPASQARLQALRRRLSDPAIQRSSGVMAAASSAAPPRAPQVEQYVRMAEAAITDNDLSSAVNTLKIALTLAPEDGELRARYKEIETKFAMSNADEYLSRARAAERDCDDQAAANWYEKATLGRPNDVKLKVQAVTALLRAKVEPKRAVTLAKNAVLLAPRDVETRLALARSYIAASAKKSAEGELRRVLELDPGNGSAKSLLKKV